MELLSFVDGGKKVYVTRTVKKTIRRIPGDGGVPTERHSVRTAHYTRNENGELVETSDGCFWILERI
jgi:hypothetical protein